MEWTQLCLIGAGLLRSVLGWLKSSLADGIIQDFEWKQLGETVVRVGLLSFVAYYFPGLDLSAFEASVVALGGDIMLSAVKKIKKV